MKLRRALIPFLLVAAVAASACGSGASTSAAATVNGQDIDRSEFERELRALRDNEELAAAGGEALKGTGKETVSAELSAGWLTALIYDAIITDEFERRDLELRSEDRDAAEAQLGTQFGNPKVADAFPDWFRKRLIERNARATAVRTAVTGFSSSEADLRKYYDQHKDEFSQACLSHILVENKEEADAVAARVKGGEDFAAVAQEKSKDPGSAQNGGDLGCNPRGVFVAEFDQAAFALPLNQPSDPVQTQFGFHILLVKERKTAEFEEAREQAKQALNNESQEAFANFLQKAVSDADVTVDSRYGKFEAREGQAPQVVPPTPPAPADGRPESGGDTGTGGTGEESPLRVEPPAGTPPEGSNPGG